MNLKVYEIPNNVKVGIYILLNDDEVVYVGQTKSGLKRIMQHNDKVFNKYSYIETSKEDLDYYEDLYIMKYQPKYNNFYSYYRTSIIGSYNRLKTNLKRKLNLQQYKDFIINNNIEIKMFKKYETITKKDSLYIKNLIEKEYGDANE